MKKALIISFDLIRKGEGPVPLSIASILSYLKNEPGYGSEFECDHMSINMLESRFDEKDYNSFLPDIQLMRYDFIAISSFIWNEHLINPFIRFLRSSGFEKKIVLGGSQVTYANRDQLKLEYPEADIFISGYAEKSFAEVLKAENSHQTFFNEMPDFEKIHSSNLNKEMNINRSQEMIRWETKRGCPFKCSFCAHRNLENGKVHYLHLDKVFAELDLFKQKEVKKVNVLDPIFNMGSDYPLVLKEIDRLNFRNTTFSLQTKMELLSKKDGYEFLDMVERNNMHLEFGIQTLIPEEYKVIKRANNVDIIAKHLPVLRDRNISYETSLIYGLPNQTPDSFQKSIDLLRNAGCKNITAWPLMLLKGTELYAERQKWNLKEEVIGGFQIPMVVSGNTFDYKGWERMHEIAQGLNANQRI